MEDESKVQWKIPAWLYIAPLIVHLIALIGCFGVVFLGWAADPRGGQP